MSNNEIKSRITHFRESKRIVTSVYKWHFDGKVEYGATIWRPDKPGDVQSKKMRALSVKTATGRLEKNPVVFFVEPGKTTAPSLCRRMRDVIRKLGVHGYSRRTPTNRDCQGEELGETCFDAFEKYYKRLEPPREQSSVFENHRWRFVGCGKHEVQEDKCYYRVALEKSMLRR